MAEYSIIPHPSALRRKKGYFVLDQDTVIWADSHNLANAEYLQGLLRPATGFPFVQKPAGDGRTNKISLTINKDLSRLGRDGYCLTILKPGVFLSASTATGIFRAIQTLRQLLPLAVESEAVVEGVDWLLPCVEIEDYPAYPWRGFMLDEARHFHGVRTVKRLLDQMALLKLNRFHWHLTDDQGWRIEIKQYPRLTEIGGQRAGSLVRSPYLSKQHNQIPHLGFYSQDEIREIVAYADERQIMVIPEIEMPGHSMAALAAYPEFSCTGGPFAVPTGWGIFPDIYCAGKAETYSFLENVLTEVFDLFPAPYLHIGGDEAPKRRWKACPDCQKKIADHQLADEHALQVFLTNHIAAFASKSRKRIIFWSDSFDQGIDPQAIVQFWIGNRRRVKESVFGGRDMISSPYLSTYLDQAHETIPLSRTVEFDPDFLPIPKGSKGRVLGFEGLLWGEWLPNFRRVEYQAFPRLAALAESGWSPQKRRQDFHSRMENYLHRLDLINIGFAPLEKAEPGFLAKLLKYIQIIRPKRGFSRSVEDRKVNNNLIQVPLNIPGKLYRSPMPFATFDFGGTTFQEILDSEISTMVMLTQEEEDHHYINKDLKQLYEENSMRVIHYPIVDFDTPVDSDDLRNVLQRVADQCRDGENIAVHCYAGRGRTGLFIALLVRLITGMDGQQAIDYTRQYFPAIETEEQEQLVRDFKFDSEEDSQNT